MRNQKIDTYAKTFSNQLKALFQPSDAVKHSIANEPCNNKEQNNNSEFVRCSECNSLVKRKNLNKHKRKKCRDGSIKSSPAKTKPRSGIKGKNGKSKRNFTDKKKRQQTRKEQEISAIRKVEIEKRKQFLESFREKMKKTLQDKNKARIYGEANVTGYTTSNTNVTYATTKKKL